MKRIIKWLLRRGREHLIVTGVAKQQASPKPKQTNLFAGRYKHHKLK